MKKPANMFVKNLRYICLIGVIALGLMTIVCTGGGDGGGGSSTKLFSVQGIVFHDMNGNGTQETAYGIDEANYSGSGWRDMTSVTEPPIQDATVRIGSYEAVTDENGWFSLSVPSGNYQVTIEKENFRFYFKSKSSMIKLESGIPITISGDTSRDFGIGIGCFTLPYKKSDHGKIGLHGYADINPTFNEPSRYNHDPDSQPSYSEGEPVAGTGDAHRGIDYWVKENPENYDVVAMAPGMVYLTALAGDNMPMIIIIHTDYEAVSPSTDPDVNWAPVVGLQSSYQHLGSYAPGIEPGTLVQRGQVIGTIGNHEAYSGYHLHVDVGDAAYKHLTEGKLPYVDLFRDIVLSPGVLSFLWHVSDSLYISQGSPGYWSADNSPQYFD